MEQQMESEAAMTAELPRPTTTPRAPALAIVVRKDPKGPPLAKEIVTDVDLTDARSELWLESCLRKGLPDVALDDLSFRLQPVLATGSGQRCLGYVLETTNPRGALVRREFTIYSLSLVANRAAQRLIELGVLESLDTYHYELIAEPAAPAVHAPGEAALIRSLVRTKPLQYLRVPVAVLRKDAKRFGPKEDDDSFPVFYTAAARTRAERFSRKGAKQNPPIETGACLVGIPVSCPDTGEFALVVTDALEAVGSQGTKLSLFYTGESWARITTVVAAMQAAHPQRAIRLAGQAHGHNWLPHDGVVCAECLKRDQCTATNAFASMDDRVWMNAVHTREPFALCHIFGRTARGDEVEMLAGLRDGRLIERSFFVIPEFDPARFESQATTHGTMR
jgi:hypothetical protein